MTAKLDLDRIGMDAANTAFMMDTPHPKGFILSNAMRVRRAVRAYEWFKDHKEFWGESCDYVVMPDAAKVQAMILEMEAADE
jgi:hypothetical protein